MASLGSSGLDPPHPKVDGLASSATGIGSFSSSVEAFQQLFIASITQSSQKSNQEPYAIKKEIIYLKHTKL